MSEHTPIKILAYISVVIVLPLVLVGFLFGLAANGLIAGWHAAVNLWDKP